METILFYIHHTFNLLWGVSLSAAFSGVSFNKRNFLITAGIFTICGLSQILTLVFAKGSEEIVWQLYPLLVHLPLIFFTCILFKKRPITVIAAVTLAYLCCQPSKWFGLFTENFVTDPNITWIVKIITAFITSIVILHYIAPYIANIFNKDTRSVLIFASVPLVYYLFDYIVGIYTDLWATHCQLAAEFLSFSLCIFFMIFCIIYYKEYEQKLDAQHKEEIIRIIAEQQTKEVDTIKKSNFETNILRHDMRLLLSNLSLCIEHNDEQQALKMISNYAQKVEAASIQRFCQNDTLNYVLTYFKHRCNEAQVSFSLKIEINKINFDEMLFSSIISNTLDNALNAQKELPIEERQIKMIICEMNGKTLLSIKNPFARTPIMIDGIPVSNEKDHGYGIQSIRYISEKLGGKSQFIIQDNMFIVRIVL